MMAEESPYMEESFREGWTLYSKDIVFAINKSLICNIGLML